MTALAPELQSLETGWDHAARHDPFFNILTIHGLTEPQFWATGNTEITAVIDLLTPLQKDAALDFGCGIGRLSQALAQHFAQVHGIDISSEMTRLANEHNQYPEQVSYLHNPAPDLSLFPDDSFDLVYSSIVLQHMPTEFAGGYVREFVRVTRPGGWVVFQIPDESTNCANSNAWLSMYGAPRETVLSWLDGATVVDIQDSDAAGSLVSHRYIVRI